MDFSESAAASDPSSISDDHSYPDGRRRIGDIFVELGFITATQLDAALEVQREKGGRIGEILVMQGSLTRLDLASALAEHWEPHRFPAPDVRRGRTGLGPSLVGFGRDGAVPSLAGDGQADASELEDRLRAAEERLAAVENTAATRETSVPPEVVERLRAQEQELARLREDLAASQRAAEEARAGAESAAAALERETGSLAARIDELRELRSADPTQGGEELREGLARVEQLLAGLSAFDHRLNALEAHPASDPAELVERVHVHEQALAGLREELAASRRADEEARAGAQSTAASVAHETAALAARIEELRGDLRSTDPHALSHATTELSARIDELAKRLDAQVDASELERRLRSAEERLAAFETAAASHEIPIGPTRGGDEQREELGRVEQLQGGLSVLDFRLQALETRAQSEPTDLAERLRSQEHEVARLRQEFAARMEEIRSLRSAEPQASALATEQLSARIDHLALGLDVQQGHIVATERTLLDGLSALRTALAALEQRDGERRDKKDRKKNRRFLGDV